MAINVKEKNWVKGWSSTKDKARKKSAWIYINKTRGLGELFLEKNTEKRSYLESIELTEEEMKALARFIDEQFPSSGGTE